MPENKIDQELLEVIDKAISENQNSSVAALDAVIKFEKEHRELVGMHISFDSFAQIDEDENAETEKRAKAVLAMIKASAAGELEDITNETL